MSQGNVQQIVAEYKEGLRRILGSRLVEVVLYGSHARGDARESSDIDVLCVMRGPLDYEDIIRATSELTASLSLDYEVVLSRVFVSESDYEERRSPFLMNVRKEGTRV